MAQRISRAKQTIKASGLGFELPPEPERSERLRAVLHVLYLIFNEGYTATSGHALQRIELAAEAIRLTREVHRLVPGDGEISALLALMLLTHARRRARVDASGALIALADQDRALWDRAAIGEGVSLVTSALAGATLGPYQLQAAIAALHDEAASAAETDWPQILALYELLVRLCDNPVVALNRAVAVAMARGPRAGLDELARLEADGRMPRDHRAPAVRAHLLELTGDRAGARACYRDAAERATNLPLQRYLNGRAARLGGSA